MMPTDDRIMALFAAECQYLNSSGWILSGESDELGRYLYKSPNENDSEKKWDHDEAVEHQKMMDGI